MKKILTLILLFIIFADNKGQDKNWLITAPAGKEQTKINRKEKTIIPNGRFITPKGNIIVVAPHPYGLILTNDGNTAITANSGTEPLSISIIKNINSENPEVMQIPPGSETDKGVLASVFMGLAVSPDDKTVYVAGGQENKIYLFDLLNGNSIGAIDCSYNDDSTNYSDGYIGDLIITKNGKTIYAVDQINFRVVVIDVENKKLTHSIKVGRYPFGITLSPDEKNIFVANVGMYEYKFFPSLNKEKLSETALDYPSSGYLTEESIEGYKNDSVTVPGLGDPNVPESFSVWKIEKVNNSYQVTSKTKTGFLVGQMIEGIPAVGGSSPNSVVATDKYVFVSNGNNDCISVIDYRTGELIKNIFIKPDERVKKFRGVIPFGLAISPDNKKLFVAESGINAIGVIDIETLEIKGHIPAGWFPSKLKVTPDGKKLVVASAKGFGSGPNGGPNFKPGEEGSSIGKLMKGIVTVLDISTNFDLDKETKQVINNNYKFTKIDNLDDENPIPLYPGQKESPIKHIVFISKENRTYDEVFGQVKNGDGEPSLARFGLGVTFTNENQSDTVKNADVMPNHLKLADKYSISDNFYCDSDHSADGHRWLVNTYPNEWVETNVTASYGGNKSFKEDSKSPGIHAFVGATGAIYPEDYNEAGSLWEHLDRNNIDFFNFGFGLELAPSYSEKAFKYTGVKFLVNYPVPKPLYEKSSRIYATYNMGIPDQFRVDMFIKEFKDKWMGENKTLPSVITIILPNDHGSGERPDDGYPYKESYMADNDLGLGRIVEFLSRTPYWKNMTIVVTEDDPQGGVDHIDAHRSILMVISPYAKKNYVGKYHYSFGSIFKTFWNILGIPYLNQYDAAANDLRDMFTSQPDFSPYNALPVDSRVFNPQKALDPLDENFNWKAVIETPILDNPQDMLDDSKKYDEQQKQKEQEKR